MDRSRADGAALAECITPLSEDSRRAVLQYWDQVIWEEWAEQELPYHQVARVRDQIGDAV